MTLKAFIREHREEIDEAIVRAVGSSLLHKSDEERRLWVLNDENLYLWARSKGVKI